jgi:hypothetical protein
VVKNGDAAEVRIVVAAVHAAAADAVLVAHHLPKVCARLVTARLFEEIDLRQKARGRQMTGKGGSGGAETLPQQVINNSAVLQQE